MLVRSAHMLNIKSGCNLHIFFASANMGCAVPLMPNLESELGGM